MDLTTSTQKKQSIMKHKVLFRTIIIKKTVLGLFRTQIFGVCLRWIPSGEEAQFPQFRSAFTAPFTAGLHSLRY